MRLQHNRLSSDWSKSVHSHERPKEFPIFKGSTEFDASPNIHNILVTGAAGFMYVSTDSNHCMVS